MVASKRCKICSVLDVNNVSITGEYFGKNILEVISTLCGIEIEKRKAVGVLICQHCALQLMHTELFVGKVRSGVQRLKKNVKERKPKTPSKNSATTIKNTTECENGGNLDKSEVLSHSIETSIVDKAIKKVKSKPVHTNTKITKPAEENLQNGETPTAGYHAFKKILDNDVTPLKTNTSKASKRKLTSTDATLKRNKTMSTSEMEESRIEITVNEQNAADSNNETAVEQDSARVLNCIVCNKIFYSKSTLRDHVDESHTNIPLKACPNCSLEFRSVQKYESHVFSEKCLNAKHACQHPNCNKRFKTVHKMELHMQQRHVQSPNY